MKDLNQHIKPSIAINSQKEVQKKQVLLGRMVIKPGMKCFEFNYKTGTIIEAEYSKQNIVLTGSPINQISRKVISKENCLYCVAINVNNAEKKFLKLFKITTPKQ